MLSLVDLKDFAEICRAIEEHMSSGRRIEGHVGPNRRTRIRAWAVDDAPIADRAAPTRRFYREASVLE